MKRIGDYTVKVHREPDPITREPRAVGSRIIGPLGSFRVPHWPTRIQQITESGPNILVTCGDGQSRPYLTGDNDRLTEAAIATSETYDTLAGESKLSERQIGQLRFLVHGFDGNQANSAKRLAEAGLTKERSTRLAAWIARQHSAMGKWKGVDSGEGRPDPMLEARAVQRAPARLSHDAPQLPAGALDALTAHAHPVVRGMPEGNDPFVALYESDRDRSAQLLADTEAQLREASKYNRDCTALVARWLALHGDPRSLAEADAKLVGIVAERVVRGAGPLSARSKLDQRVIEAQQIGFVVEPEQRAKPDRPGGVITQGLNGQRGEGQAQEHAEPQFTEGSRPLGVDETEARIVPGETARCGHKIREGRRTCPHCGEGYQLKESPWKAPAQVVKALATNGPWTATVQRAQRDLGYLVEGDPQPGGEVTLVRAGLETITVAFARGDGLRVEEARLVEAGQHLTEAASDAQLECHIEVTRKDGRIHRKRFHSTDEARQEAAKLRKHPKVSSVKVVEGDAGLTEAKHKGPDKCPWCGHGGMKGDEKKCPGCGESLKLGREDKKVDAHNPGGRAHGERFKGPDESAHRKAVARARGFRESFVESVVDEALLERWKDAPYMGPSRWGIAFNNPRDRAEGKLKPIRLRKLYDQAIARDRNLATSYEAEAARHEQRAREHTRAGRHEAAGYERQNAAHKHRLARYSRGNATKHSRYLRMAQHRGMKGAEKGRMGPGGWGERSIWSNEADLQERSHMMSGLRDAHQLGFAHEPPSRLIGELRMHRANGVSEKHPRVKLLKAKLHALGGYGHIISNTALLRQVESGLGDAVQRPGQLHRDLRIPAGEKISLSKVQAAARSHPNADVRRRANLALVFHRARKKKHHRGLAGHR